MARVPTKRNSPNPVQLYFERASILDAEYGENEMEYVYSTGIRERIGIQIRVFHLYSGVFHVFQWNSLSPSALEYDVEYVFPF